MPSSGKTVGTSREIAASQPASACLERSSSGRLLTEDCKVRARLRALAYEVSVSDSSLPIALLQTVPLSLGVTPRHQSSRVPWFP